MLFFPFDFNLFMSFISGKREQDSLTLCIVLAGIIIAAGWAGGTVTTVPGAIHSMNESVEECVASDRERKRSYKRND